MYLSNIKISILLILSLIQTEFRWLSEYFMVLTLLLTNNHNTVPAIFGRIASKSNYMSEIDVKQGAPEYDKMRFSYPYFSLGNKIRHRGLTIPLLVRSSESPRWRFGRKKLTISDPIYNRIIFGFYLFIVV